MQELLKINHRPAKFGGTRHCGSRDVMILVCPVIPKNHGLKESCDFFGGSPSM